MKKISLLILILLLSISYVGCSRESRTNGSNPEEQNSGQNVYQNEKADKEAVAALVLNFGQKMQMVPLLASTDIVTKSMQDNYGSLVSPALLEEWQNDPQNAPGRLVSSPWPDHIEILSNEKAGEEVYEVKGEIIEITSVEQSSGGAAAKRAITLTVKKNGENWLIDDVILGAYVDSDTISYINTQYGFTFTLPKSWDKYSIIASQWEGRAIAGTQSSQIVETGQIISIRHPLWTAQKPRQDIPIMIFTLAQWDAIKNEEISVGAAPIPPSELGRNSRYVFALPARYNYAFPEGFEEVENILAKIPLQANENIDPP